MYQGSADFIAANASIIQKHKIRGIIGTTSFDGDNLLDLTITKKVVDLKAEIEKIREQIQNIE